jgi:hypothetical protein
MVQTRSGHIGYRDQLDRVRRFLDRVEGPHSSDVDFQDIMWWFFQHCWHLKDWVKHDPLARQDQKDQVKRAAEASALLLICRDICNGTKHLKLTDPSSGSGAAHSHVDMKITPGSGMPNEIDCVIDDGTGRLISGKQLARDCVGGRAMYKPACFSGGGSPRRRRRKARSKEARLRGRVTSVILRFDLTGEGSMAAGHQLSGTAQSQRHETPLCRRGVSERRPGMCPTLALLRRYSFWTFAGWSPSIAALARSKPRFSSSARIVYSTSG